MNNTSNMTTAELYPRAYLQQLAKLELNAAYGKVTSAIVLPEVPPMTDEEKAQNDIDSEQERIYYEAEELVKTREYLVKHLDKFEEKYENGYFTNQYMRLTFELYNKRKGKSFGVCWGIEYEFMYNLALKYLEDHLPYIKFEGAPYGGIVNRYCNALIYVDVPVPEQYDTPHDFIDVVIPVTDDSNNNHNN